MKHIRFLVLLALSFLLVFALSAQAEAAENLILDQHYTISADGSTAIEYSFTPSETGIYTFYAYPRTGEVTYLEVGFNYPDGNGVGSSSESGAVYMDVVLHQGSGGYARPAVDDEAVGAQVLREVVAGGHFHLNVSAFL